MNLVSIHPATQDFAAARTSYARAIHNLTPVPGATLPTQLQAQHAASNAADAVKLLTPFAGPGDDMTSTTARSSVLHAQKGLLALLGLVGETPLAVATERMDAARASFAAALREIS